jgi:hypothetical protein
MEKQNKDKVIVEQPQAPEMDPSWSGRVLLIGALLGTLTGLGAAYLMIQRAKNRAEAPNLNAGEGIRLGLLVLGLLRQVATLGSGDDK